MSELAGKWAIVCGSSKGIGRACAIGLAGRGASVTLVARDESALEQVRKSLCSDAGQEHGLLSADFDDPQALQGKIAAHVKESGPAHILVNNTGGPKSGPITESEPDAFASAFSQHILCNHLLTQTVLPGMKEAGFGRVINIISTSVVQPIRGLGVSNTIRAAVANWAKTMASELGAFGITVNNVLPGYTDTDRLKSLISARAQRTGVSETDVVEQWKSTIPVGRLGRPEEIAAVVAFLASPAASYVNGVNLPVDGGRLAAQ